MIQNQSCYFAKYAKPYIRERGNVNHAIFKLTRMNTKEIYRLQTKRKVLRDQDMRVGMLIEYDKFYGYKFGYFRRYSQHRARGVVLSNWGGCYYILPLPNEKLITQLGLNAQNFYHRYDSYSGVKNAYTKRWAGLAKYTEHKLWENELLTTRELSKKKKRKKPVKFGRKSSFRERT